MGQRSFSYQGAKIWTNLKTETKTASLQSFNPSHLGDLIHSQPGGGADSSPLRNIAFLDPN